MILRRINHEPFKINKRLDFEDSYHLPKINVQLNLDFKHQNTHYLHFLIHLFTQCVIVDNLLRGKHCANAENIRAHVPEIAI